LTVATETKLLLTVTNNGSQHTFKGWLKRASNGAVISGEIVSLKVNETGYVFSTASDGGFNTTLDLKPVDNNKTTFMITVSYNGSTPQNATAWTYTLNGTRYAACTTLYFGLKPSANTTVLTVDPQATEAVAQAKTQEQMQQEAQSDGTTIIWPEFSWLYPWFRLHVQVKVNPTMHVALNPLLPGGELTEWSGDLVELFADLVEEALTDMIIEVCGLLGLYLGAKALAIMGRGAQPWLFGLALVTEAVKYGLQIYLFAKSWSDRIGMLAQALVSTILGLFALAKIDVLLKFVKAVASVLPQSVASALHLLVDRLLPIFNSVGSAFSFCRDLIDYIELAGDLVFAAASWTRFFLLSAGVP